MHRHSAILVAIVASSAVLAGEPRYDFGISTAVGYTNNPLLRSTDGRGGSFAQLVIDGGMHHPLDRRTALFANGVVRSRLHEDDVADADTASGNVRVGVGYVPPIAHGRLALAAGAQGAFASSTFIDRETGGVYEVEAVPPASPGTTIRIGDRLDARTFGAFADLKFNQSRRIRWSLDTAVDRTAHTDDYAATAGLASLDQRSLTVVPGVTLVLNDLVTCGFSVSWHELDYDERPAVDASGAEVPHVTREYQEAQLRAILMLQPAPRWHLRFGLSEDDRQDTHAGYYDYRSWSSYLSAERQIARRSSLRLHGAWRELDYQRATLSAAPETLRATDVRTLLVRFEHGVGERLRWFADLGTQSTDSTDPVFTSEQDWLLTGMQFRR